MLSRKMPRAPFVGGHPHAGVSHLNERRAFAEPETSNAGLID
jgi:hypothetical protein